MSTSQASSLWTEDGEEIKGERFSTDEVEAEKKIWEEAEKSQHALYEDGALERFVQAILEPADRNFQRLQCPVPEGLARYESLKPDDTSSSTAHAPPHAKNKHIKFFFALDLTTCVNLLPRLLGSIVETLRFLGPENCALSIVEGRSQDGTREVLEAIKADVEALGTQYFLQTSNVNPKAGDRIVGLAELRNLALQPMLNDRRRYDAITTVIFLNDVAICMEDILELVYQRSILGADMTCAMDWLAPSGGEPTFYDVWISRTISGDSFWTLEGTGWDNVSHYDRFSRYLLTSHSGTGLVRQRPGNES